MMNRAAVTIPEKLFFKIGEVCDIVGIQAHVLRYWESEFPMLAPQKNRAGQRTYRKRDVEMVLRIKELLYEEQYTIPGARKRLVADIRGASKLKVVTPEMSAGANSFSAEDSSYTAPPVPIAPPPTAPPTVSPTAITQTTAPQQIEQSAFVSSSVTSPDAAFAPDQRRAVRQLRAQLEDLLTLLDGDGR